MATVLVQGALPLLFAFYDDLYGVDLLRAHLLDNQERLEVYWGGQKIMDLFMQAAIAEARQGLAEGGIPIGSILVRDGQIIGRGHNRRVQNGDPIRHAEIDCLQNAGRIGRYGDTVLYSTLMPCYLCAGAVVQFGIKRIIAGESVTFAGARAFMESHGVEVTDLDLEECKQLMQAFIQAKPELWQEDIGTL
jgi:cytosine/creatinine deaminase